MHLRLKSIYKAFKQSSRSSSSTKDNSENSSSSTAHGSSNSKPAANPQHHGKQIDEHAATKSSGCTSLADDDPQVLLQAAAAVATTASNSKSSGKKPSMNGNNVSMNASASIQAKEMVDKYMAEKEKADAAAEALLAELEEEEEAIKSKKSKKKRKKERQQAKKEEERKKEQGDDATSGSNAMLNQEDKFSDAGGSSDSEGPSVRHGTNSSTDPEGSETWNVQSVFGESIAMADKSQASFAKSTNENADMKQEDEVEPEVDPVEQKLCSLVEEGDTEGIEELLFTLKGVPGRASLRKNAKKALKRLRTPEMEDELKEENDAPIDSEEPSSAPSTTTERPRSDSFVCPPELLRVISGISENTVSGKSTGMSRSKAQPGTVRAECVMQIASEVVGFVIGKGGQRIRDLMDQSGARVWIDQDNKTPQDPRTVYVSGSRPCVESAVRILQELVSKAPQAAALTQPHLGDDNVPTGEVVSSSGPDTIVDRSKATTTSTAKSKKTGRTDSRQLKQERPRSQPASQSTPEKSTPNHCRKESPEAGTSMHVLTCEPRFVPLLIGRRGWTIKNIQDSSGARVDIDQTVTPRRIKISGTKPNVECAIRMVRDVLSYPHAQLHSSGNAEAAEPPNSAQTPSPALAANETLDQVPTQAVNTPLKGESTRPVDEQLLTTPANGSEDRNHTPPPSSLIMTGDSKSLISASSSLSSTPEPSMASTSKGYNSQLQTGPLIPPDFGASNYPMPAPSPAGSSFLQQNLALGEMGGPRTPAGMETASSPFYGGGLLGVHHQQSYGGLSPPPAFSQVHKAPVPLGSNMIGERYHGTPGIGASNPVSPQMTMQQEPNAGPHQPTRLNFSGMPHQSNQIPLHHRNAFNAPQAQFGPPDSGIQNLMGVEPSSNARRSAFESTDAAIGPGLWNQRGPTEASNQTVPRPSDPYYLDSLRLHGQGPQGAASLPLGFNAARGERNVRSVAPNRPLDPPTGALDSGRNDSLMVDSLFGPVGKGSSSEQQAILPGFQGLSINSDGLGGGVWSSSLPGWNETDGGKKNVPQEDTLFGGANPLPGNQEQHPPQSRFNWGSTNGSVGHV